MSTLQEGAGVFAGFPNPIGWAIDQVTNFAGDVATAGFEVIIAGLVAWVTDAVVWVIGGVFNYFIDASDPNVQADWFVADDGPYGTTAQIGAVLMVGFLLAGITQGVLDGDVAGMLRRMALDLPVSVLGIVGLVTLTQVLIRLTDDLSTWVMGNFEQDIADFTAVVTSLSRLGGGVATAFVILVLGLVTVLAGLILVAELTIRAALIYIVVALAPFVFAARLWPALQDTTKKLLQLLVALILSKLAMALALAVASAAAVGTGSGGEVTALPEPEVVAEDPGGSVTQAVGILLAAVAAFGIAAFSPLLVSKLLPMAEGAVVAQGLRSGPIRGAQQAMSMAYYADGLKRMRLGKLAGRNRPKSPPARTPPQPPPSRPALGPGPSRLALPSGSGSGPRALGRGPIPAPAAGGAGGLGAGGTAGAGAGAGAGGAGAAGGGAAAAGAGGAAGPAGLAVTAGVTAVKGTANAVKTGGQAIGAKASEVSDTASSGSSSVGGSGPVQRPRPVEHREGQPRRRPPNGGGRSQDG
jgi:type IV secretion system protein TrbL